MNDIVPGRFRPSRPAPRPREIRRDLRLSRDRYVDEAVDKSLVVVHHTAGASARSSFNWWQSRPQRIGAPYLIERDGTIYEVMPPERWIYALGLNHDRRVEIEKRSVHIELCNWGPLREHDGSMVAWSGTHVCDVDDQGCYLSLPWRGETAWEVYPAEQLEALVWLVEELTTMLGIPRRCPRPDRELDFELDLALEVEGIIGHSHVRRDKTDPHPGFLDGWDWLRSLPGYGGDW